MNELALFAGAGGGVLGGHLLGWEQVGYVEWNTYCQRVLAARMRDGFIGTAPIFTDVREFVQSGAAEQYRGFADVVSAGFPCQPYSSAGLQRGSDDPKDMWPATREVIRLVRPQFAWLENVPRLISLGYLSVVLGDLAALGYSARWGCVSAAAAGADHVRERLWVLAYTNGSQREGRRLSSGVHPEHTHIGGCDWWKDQPKPHGVDDGVAHRMDRLKAIGNGQVPEVAASAWRILSEGLQ